MGSEPSSRLQWSRCTDSLCPAILPKIKKHVFTADIPWDEAPTLLIRQKQDGIEDPFILARSPNKQTTDPDKYHEHWWSPTAVGASLYSLNDTRQLSNIGDIKGGRIFIMDGADRCGTFLYSRTIISHDRQRASLSVDMPIGALTYDNQESGLSTLSRYYIENAAGLLDEPGEWFYDPATKKLYLFPPENISPDQLSIEIGRRDKGVLINRSRIVIDGISIHYINDQNDTDRPTGAIVISPEKALRDIRINNVSIRHAGNGILAASKESGSLYKTVINAAQITNVSRSAIIVAGSPDRSDSVNDVRISNSAISRSGFPNNGPAIHVSRVSNLKIAGTAINDTASYGIHITGYEKYSSSAHHISVTGNTVTHACQNGSSCSAIKFFGGRFTDTIVSNNTVADNRGWSSCMETKGLSTGYAMGFFISNASGITVSNNISRNNSGPAYLGYTRQFPATDNVFSNNLAADSDVGISLDGSSGDADADPVADASRHQNSLVTGNTLLRNNIGLRLDPSDPKTLTVSRNKYQENSIALMYGDVEITTPSAIEKTLHFWKE